MENLDNFKMSHFWSCSEPWFVKSVLSWFYSSGGSKGLWARIFIHTSWTFEYCLKECCFPDCWKVSLVVPVFKNVGKRSTAKDYYPVILLSVVSKVFEKLVNNRIVDHLKKCGLFSDFQYSFRSSQSTADLLTVVSDRIARAFNRSEANLLGAFNRGGHLFKKFDFSQIFCFS